MAESIWKQEPGIYDAYRKFDMKEVGGLFPHMWSTAPWHLFAKQMAEESHFLSKQVLAGLRDNQSAVLQPLLNDESVAAVHVRCDNDIMTYHSDYGVLPKRFYLDRLPTQIRKVVMITGVNPTPMITGFDPTPADDPAKCSRYVTEMQSWFESSGRSTVIWQHGSEDMEMDWAALGNIRTVFASPSTFALSATVGNPGLVFFPRNEKNLNIAAPPKAIPAIMLVPHGRWSWVPSEFIPGQSLGAIPWEVVDQYLSGTETCEKWAAKHPGVVAKPGNYPSCTPLLHD
eukprot:gnl/TRDRNA2_/TRDRNA2_173257_c1_seq3.p1 gnl/TRDRNA2_/TRDRNA2_173257_c1~~gnl/TRDRNA2_/TRDRNA2_173257_c1_seq3.p1  ORF type:complete len:296 (-),score=31.80 gnl/TRDRNA2_/TRDRNA2_173257_c1_seq3:93-950(-)